MRVHSPASLQKYNSFKVDAQCDHLIEVNSERDLYDALVQYNTPYRVVGGGSNILLAGDLNETILLNRIKGIYVVDEDQYHTLVTVGAGENWHNFVLWSISHELSGLQNLSLIPGSVGAAPIQNIGAYGVEQSSCFHSLKAISLSTGLSQVFYKQDCQFDYRESIFKNELKDKVMITHVTYMLSKQKQIDTHYGAIRTELDRRGIHEPTLEELSEVICDIRRSKLPDPRYVGNAGSFFKNPIVSIDQYEKLLQSYPDIVAYPYGDEMKLSAGWLIDRAGWKGKEMNGAQVYDKHALVLINQNTRSGLDIWNLAMAIQSSVKEMYGVSINPEVNVWGRT